MRNFLMNTANRAVFAADGPGSSGSGWRPLVSNGQFTGPVNQQTSQPNNPHVEEEPVEPTEEELLEDPTLAQDGENFFDAVTEMWDDPPPADDAPKPLTQEQIEANNTAAATRLDNYVKGLDLSVVIDPEKFKEAAEANDPKILTDAIAQAQQKSYKQMLRDVTRMVGEVRNELRGEMDTAAQRRLQVSASEQSLVATLPFIEKKKALRPIAVAVKARFLKRGFDDEKANVLTKRFFQETQSLTADALDDVTQPPSRRTGDRTFQETRPQRGRRSNDDIDWAGVLTGRDRT